MYLQFSSNHSQQLVLQVNEVSIYLLVKLKTQNLKLTPSTFPITIGTLEQLTAIIHIGAITPEQDEWPLESSPVRFPYCMQLRTMTRLFTHMTHCLLSAKPAILSHVPIPPQSKHLIRAMGVTTAAMVPGCS